jgi:hypothetical protein
MRCSIVNRTYGFAMKSLAITLLLAIFCLVGVAHAQSGLVAEVPFESGGGGGAGGSGGTTITQGAGDFGAATAQSSAVLTGVNVAATGANGVFPVNAQLTAVGSGTITQAATPTGLTVTPTGGAATSRCYRVSCVSNTFATLAETEVCDASGPTTLDSTHYETVAVTFPQNGCDHMRFYGRATGAELKTSDCPGGTNCIAAAGGVISWKDNGTQTPSGALPTYNSTGGFTATIGPSTTGGFNSPSSGAASLFLNASNGNGIVMTNTGSLVNVVVAGTTVFSYWIGSLATTVANITSTTGAIGPTGGGVLQSYGGTVPTCACTGGSPTCIVLAPTTCTGSGTPYACCTGSGAGATCPISTNTAGEIEMSGATAATTCTLTFSASGTFHLFPTCEFSDANASVTPLAFSTGAVSTTTAVIDFAAATANQINYVCIGH